MAATSLPRIRFRLPWPVDARRLGLWSAVGLLVVSNVVSNRLLPQAYIPWNLAVAAALLVLARRCGVSWEQLGLGNQRLRKGLFVGATAAAVVAVTYLVGLWLPATRAAFLDARAAGPLPTVLFIALVRVPLGTVLLEEVAFRGVLPALTGDRFWPGAVLSSVLFGLWHVLPSMGMASSNAAVGAAVGGFGSFAQVTLAVVAMTAAGLLLMAWRRWGGHLASPALLHVATNSLGALIAWWALTH